MDHIYQQQKNVLKGILVWLSLVVSALLGVNAYSFELLSEGAMDSVSVVTEESAEDFLNVAGPTAAGLRTDYDYEDLPFDVDVERGEIVRDEVSTEINFAFTQEVEEWANNLRRTGRLELDEFIINEGLRETYVDIIVGPGKQAQTLNYDSSGQDLLFEFGKLELTKDFRANGFDSITGSVQRHLDSVSVQDFRTDRTDIGASIGNAYITDITSRSNITVTGRTRD